MAQISAADFTGYDADIIMEIYVAEKIMLMSTKGRGLEMVGKMNLPEASCKVSKLFYFIPSSSPSPQGEGI